MLVPETSLIMMMRVMMMIIMRGWETTHWGPDHLISPAVDALTRTHWGQMRSFT